MFGGVWALRPQRDDVLEHAERLLELRNATALLDREVLIEGFAAERSGAGLTLPGLGMVTSWRIIFVDVESTMSAIRIWGILILDARPPAMLVISAWHDQMRLAFDGRAALTVVVDLFRREPAWDTVNPSNVRSLRRPDVRVWADRAGAA